MKKIPFKFTYSQLNCIGGVLHRMATERKRVEIAELLPRAVAIVLIIRIKKKTLFKFENEKTFSFEYTEAIAIHVLMSEVNLDYFTEYEAAVMLPIYETIGKLLTGHKNHAQQFNNLLLQ